MRSRTRLPERKWKTGSPAPFRFGGPLRFSLLRCLSARIRPRALGPAFPAAAPGACVIPSRPTRGLALGLPPGLWPAALGPFLRGPGRSAWRQHHGGYRDVKRERRRGQFEPGRAGCPGFPRQPWCPHPSLRGLPGADAFLGRTSSKSTRKAAGTAGARKASLAFPRGRPGFF